MTRRLLIDVRPAVGGHGERGIGRYVRGLADSIGELPTDLADRIWAVGFRGPTLHTFGTRAVTDSAHRGLGRVPSWVTGWLDTNSALRRSGARVLHATDPQQPWSGVATASIVTVYDLIPLRDQRVRVSWRPDHRLAYRWYLRQISLATRIVAISNSTAQDVQERLGIEPERINVVYPVVACSRAVGRTEAPEPTFLFVGALDAHKQPELAMEAFSLFRGRFGDGRLRYIGPSNLDQQRVLRERAARLGVSPFISFEGRIAEEDLELAFRSATALIWTSHIEGFGLPPVEAVLRGVPVVAVQTPAAVETLDGVALIVPPNPEAIAEAMAKPVQPSEAIVSVLRERFSVGSVARSLANAYRAVLD